MPGKAGTFNIFPWKSPAVPIPLGEPRDTPHQQETQRRILEGVNQLPTESTRSYKLFFHRDTKCCTQSPSGQRPTEWFNSSWARPRLWPSATEGLWGPRALPQKPAPHGSWIVSAHPHLQTWRERAVPSRLFDSSTNTDLLKSLRLPQHWVQSLTRAMPNYQKSLLI